MVYVAPQRLEDSENAATTRVTILKEIEVLAKQASGKGSHVQLFQVNEHSRQPAAVCGV